MNDGKEKIKKQLEAKKKRLSQIEHPKEPEVCAVKDYQSTQEAFKIALENHSKVQIFLEELDNLSSLLDASKDVLFELATPMAIKRLMKKADYSSTEMDGEFCKVVLIRIPPFPDLRLVQIESVKSVLCH